MPTFGVQKVVSFALILAYFQPKVNHFLKAKEGKIEGI